MTEPCENCGTEVAAMDVVATRDTGWQVCTLPDEIWPLADVHTVEDAVEGVGVYEYTRGEDRPPGSVMPPTVALAWFEHTPARCQRARQQRRAAR